MAINDTTFGSDSLEFSKLLRTLNSSHLKELMMSFGGKQRTMVTGSAWTGLAFAVTFVTETTPTTFTMNDTTGTLSGIVYPAGLTLYGSITAITPAAGESVIIYSL